jgi:hypothetical protein
MSAPDSPKILENLVAAGLVSHELIGDPDRLAGENAALAALCARVTGPVYRLGPFHYAFRLDGRDEAARPGDARAEGAALEAALAAELGEEAVWISAAEAGGGATDLDREAILFLRAGDQATMAALAEAPEIRAVIAAGSAARAAETAARLAAGAVAGAAERAGGDAAHLAARLERIEARLDGIEKGAARLDGPDGLAARFEILEGIAARLERIEARLAIPAEQGPAGFERVAGLMEVIARRLAEQSARAGEAEARGDALASGIAALESAMEAVTAATVARSAGEARHFEAALAGFETRLGHTLAEFLARLTTAGEAATPPRVAAGREAAPARAAV